MTEQPERSMFAADGVAAPLRHAAFRRIWLASLLSNLGLLIQAVGAAWAMTQMTSSADKVALVQTALMLPIMLISMPAGAIADMYDRRIVALVSLSIALVRRHRPDGAGVARPGHAGDPAGVLLHRRQRHGAVRPGLAILGQRAGAGGNAALRGGAERHQLQHRAKFWPGDRRHRRRHRRRGRSLRRQRGALSSAADRAVSLAPHQRAVAAAARAAQPRHGVGRALHRQFAVDPHRADAHAGDRPDRRFGIGADAAGRARSAAWRRADLRHHARRLRHGRGDRRAQYRRSAQADERRGRDPRLRAVDGRRDRRGRAEPGAGADRGGAGGRRRGVDAGGRPVQHRRAALGAALGRGPLAGGLPGVDCRRHRDRKLGLGTPDRRGRRARPRCWFPPP